MGVQAARLWQPGRRRWVVTTRTQRLTTQQAPHHQRGSPPHRLFDQHLLGVGRTRGRKPASGRQPARHPPSIPGHSRQQRQDQDPIPTLQALAPGHQGDPAGCLGLVHAGPDRRERGGVSNSRDKPRSSATTVVKSASGQGTRATITMSCARGHFDRRARKDSRSSRRMRARAGAWPTPLDTASPRRHGGKTASPPDLG